MRKKITKKQTTDAGMAAVLILLIVGLYTQQSIYYKIAVGALLINMIVPEVYYAFAIFWFGLAKVLGAIVPKILLSVIFFLLVVPVGLLRKISGKDSLLLTKFKKSTQSVLKVRNHTYSVSDIEKPY